MGSRSESLNLHNICFFKFYEMRDMKVSELGCISCFNLKSLKLDIFSLFSSFAGFYLLLPLCESFAWELTFDTESWKEKWGCFINHNYNSYLLCFIISTFKVWRFITYIFYHVCQKHLFTNICAQILVGFPLESTEQSLRVICLYLAGEMQRKQ